MKFKHDSVPKIGSTKKESKFLLFPMRLGNETRWLERVTIEYVFTEVFVSDGFSGGLTKKWIADKFDEYDRNNY